VLESIDWYDSISVPRPVQERVSPIAQRDGFGTTPIARFANDPESWARPMD
jgi:hypothetical protein